MFVIDAVTRLVKLVDFQKLKKRDYISNLKSLLMPIINDLNGIPSADPSENIDHSSLVEEIMGSLVDTEDLIYADSFKSVSSFDVSGQWIDSLTFEGYFGENIGLSIDDEPPGQVAGDQLPDSLIETWKIESYKIVSKSGTSRVYSATLSSASSLGFQQGVIVEVTDPKSSALHTLLSITSEDISVAGIPRLGGIEPKMKGGFFAIWKIDYADLLPLTLNIFNLPDFSVTKVRESILTVVEFLHDHRISLGSKDQSNSIFFMDTGTSEIKLIDFASLMPEPDKPPEFFAQEFNDVRTALDQIFPEAVTLTTLAV
jgi:hypothetical protein